MLKTNCSLLKSTIYTLLILLLTGCFNSDPATKAVDAFIATQKIDTTKADWKTNLPLPEQVSFNLESHYYWDLETTEGKLIIKLLPDIAPMHVTSTIYLTTLGFYNGLNFHRVISAFMAQGGDPLGNGQGNPGYTYPGEFSEQVTHNKAGLLSMANSGVDTDGSQFFITLKATPWLNGKHTIFGEVVEGGDSTLLMIEKLGSRTGKVTKEVKIIKASIRVE